MDKKDKMGGEWDRETRGGKPMRGIQMQYTADYLRELLKEAEGQKYGVKVNYIAFPNGYKSGNQPDWIIYKSKPRDSAPEEITETEFF